MARVGIIYGGFGEEREVARVRGLLTATGHTVEELGWHGDFYAAPLRYTGFDLYILIRSGGLSASDKKNLSEVAKSGRRVLLLYTLQKPDFEARVFASVSLSSTKECILRGVENLTS